MPVSEDSLNKIVVCFKGTPKLLSKSQVRLALLRNPFFFTNLMMKAKMAAERFAKCYAYPKGLDFVKLIEELEYEWDQPTSSSSGNRPATQGRGGKRNRGKR